MTQEEFENLGVGDVIQNNFFGIRDIREVYRPGYYRLDGGNIECCRDWNLISKAQPTQEEPKMNETEELIKEFRDCVTHSTLPKKRYLTQAADLIESQQAKIEQLESELAGFKEPVGDGEIDERPINDEPPQPTDESFVARLKAAGFEEKVYQDRTTVFTFHHGHMEVACSTENWFGMTGIDDDPEDSTQLCRDMPFQDAADVALLLVEKLEGKS